MREIKKPELKPSENITSGENIRLTLLIDPLLSTKVRNVLNAQWTQGNFTYETFSAFVRQAFETFQQGNLKLLDYQGKTKKEVSVRFPLVLYNYYQTLNKGKRSFIINSVLNSFLKQIT